MGSSRKNVLKPDNVEYLLESTNIKELKLAKEITDKRLKFTWVHYSELAIQRHLIMTDLKQAIAKNCIAFSFDKWQRAVKYQYALHPLCTIGSWQFIGGRFNYGNSINDELAAFPALYIANDKDTALQEHLGQTPAPKGSKLTPREIALTATESETIVSVSGKVEQVFDLTDKNNLEGFVELIKSFKTSPHLAKMAREAQMGKVPLLIKSVDKLLDSLLDKNWRRSPSNFDIPSNSQIFGHIAYIAGIEGILYPSKFTGKSCLAIFPNNFSNSNSYIKLDGKLPPYEHIVRVIDKDNYHLCEFNEMELLAFPSIAKN